MQQKAVLSLIPRHAGSAASARDRIRDRWAWIGILALGLWGDAATAAFQEDAAIPQDKEKTTAVDALDAELTAQWKSSILPSLQKHCGDCHMQGNTEAGVGLDDYDSLDKIRSHESTWEQIRGVIRAEAMPPPESSSMTLEERRALTDWIARALHEVDCGCRPSVPEVTIRRLNQKEYDNTVRDLFGLDVTPSKEIGFVSDDVGNGFDNQGEVLTMPPIAMEKYLKSAAWIAEKVIAKDREAFGKQSFEGESLRYHEALHVPVYLAEGKYQLSIRARFGDDQKDNCKARLLVDGQPAHTWDVLPKDETEKTTIELSPGDHTLSIEYADDENAEARDAPNRRLIVHTLRLVGPEQGQPAFPKAHAQLVIATPEDRDAPDGLPIGLVEATRRVFKQFLPRAYRRPVDESQIEALVMLCQKANDAGYSYEESLRFGVQAALVSPQFLYLDEVPVEHDDGSRGIDDYSLANRLSYFLWSTMPDPELMQVAGRGQLREPEVLRQQVQRMLNDKRSEALLSGFFSQWLGLRNLKKIDIDREKFPAWSDRLRDAMIRETEMFCNSVLREGKIRDFLLADYTFVNPRLAEYYGVAFDGRDPSELYRRRPGRRGNDMRRQGLYDDEDKWIRVTLPDQRRGMMTQAAVLALTSNPTRSSPVKRGKWILETVLGDPPPSAPPNVPTLEQAKAADGASLRERLEIHRSNPSCAGCHKLMDPIGLGLENFDAIGRWRDAEGEGEGKLPIDARGELADGRSFGSPRELVSILAEKEDSMARNFVERMLTYALGRGLQRPDRCDVDTILEQSRADGFAIRSILECIATSDAFRQHQSAPAANGAANGAASTAAGAQ